MMYKELYSSCKNLYVICTNSINARFVETKRIKLLQLPIGVTWWLNLFCLFSYVFGIVPVFEIYRTLMYLIY